MSQESAEKYIEVLTKDLREAEKELIQLYIEIEKLKKAGNK